MQLPLSVTEKSAQPSI